MSTRVGLERRSLRDGLPVVGGLWLALLPLKAMAQDALPWSAMSAPLVPLHPVHDQIWLRWQQATAAQMSGPTASPLYRETASDLGVAWTLLADAQWDPGFTDADAQQARDLAVAGATQGLLQAVRDTLDRSETLHVVREVAHTAVSPGLAITRRDGRTQLEIDTRPEDPAATRAAIDLPRAGAPRPSSAPLVRIGTGLGLIDDDPGPTEQPVPAVEAWLNLGNPGRASLRADAQWKAPWDAPGTPLPRWELTARLPLRRGFAFNLDTLGSSQTGLPLRARATLSHPIPHHPLWILRLGSTHRSLADSTDPGEWRVDLGLRANFAWHIPVDIDRWPLGQEPGTQGPVWPSIPDASPNQLVPLVRPPVDRALDPLPSLAQVPG